MLSLTNKQLIFLKKELGLDKSSIESMSSAEWREIREKCFDIVVEETGNADVADEEDLPERFLLAEEIADITFASLHAGGRT